MFPRLATIILILSAALPMKVLSMEDPKELPLEHIITCAFNEQATLSQQFTALNQLITQSNNIELQARARIKLADWYWRGIYVKASNCTACDLLEPIKHMPVREKLKDAAYSLIATITGNYGEAIDRYYRSRIQNHE